MLPIKRQLDTQKTIDDLIKRVNVLSKISGRNGIKVVEGSSGIQLLGGGVGGGVNIKIFRVVSADTGDGIYNCFEQVLDATDWDDTDGANKFVDKDTVNVEVLNLAEFNPEPTYVAHLVANDLISAWKEIDDESNARWIGVPFRSGMHGNVNRIAYCAAGAGGANSIVCYLDTDVTGTIISVNCIIAGGGTLNTASPRLTVGLKMIVTKIGATWWSTTVFQRTEDCLCNV